MKKLSQEEVLRRFKYKYGDKYDYSKVQYKTYSTEVKIICPVDNHGEFFVKPKMHMIGSECPKCYKRKSNKKLSKKEFIERSNIVHNYKYDYSKVNYKNVRTEVIITCNKLDNNLVPHGEFLQLPQNHLRNFGCPKCFLENNTLTQDEAISKLRKKFPNYDYSLVKYINNSSKIKIICPEHGEFETTYGNFINSRGCNKCSGFYKRDLEKLFIKLNNKYLNKYNYDEVSKTYSGLTSKIKIICPEHGEFETTMDNHLKGRECQLCYPKDSRGEKRIIRFLKANNINYNREYRFKDCCNIKPLPFDFYLPDKNILIEYDGKQHFEPVEYFGGLEGLKKTQDNDKIKTEYCLKNNIELVRIKYTDFDKIEEILKKSIGL